ncbi:large conductance mechanosensitive channel protein MscL [Singulisphaera sp. Ch08]|uniref:Large-conductance mechanosensitive channel n=1 Tax=Singulisphaera sp. Ch08 TaxID=3120278 RepID=A0AAU7C8E8_9BACT
MDIKMDIKHLDPKKQASTLLNEFKTFAFKGNVIDLAVGVIIGAAFGKIITSLVDHIIMPLIGVILPGKSGYQGWKATINGKEIPYGLFLGDIVNFLIVAVALFLFIVKFLGWIMRTRKEEAKAAPPLTKEQELLSEIRDLLKLQAKTKDAGGPP